MMLVQVSYSPWVRIFLSDLVMVTLQMGFPKISI